MRNFPDDKEQIPGGKPQVHAERELLKYPYGNFALLADKNHTGGRLNMIMRRDGEPRCMETLPLRNDVRKTGSWAWLYSLIIPALGKLR
jgi:hypothetical protein